MKKLTPLPLLRAGIYSAFELLTHVERLVIEEPQRLNMTWFILKYKGTGAFGGTSQTPACGTVGCVAGWVGLNVREPNPGNYNGGMAFNALCGPSGADNLRAYRDLYKLFFPSDLKETPGSRAYVRDVAKRIRTVRKKHATFFKARTLQIKRVGYEVVTTG